jgi:hypothetical protein
MCCEIAEEVGHEAFPHLRSPLRRSTMRR